VPDFLDPNGLLYLFLTSTVMLWVILDPPGLLPVFIGVTSSFTPKQRNQAALKASLVALGIIFVFAVAGQYIMDFLGISIPALRVSGGLLLLLIALDLLTGKMDEAKPVEGSAKLSVAIVPLGTPLLAGPGTIVAMMVQVKAGGEGAGWEGKLVVALALVVAMFFVWVFMRFAGAIRKVIRESGVTLLTRIAGLLVAAIAVEMMATGVMGFVDAYLGG
jgi:multiple antibiotic resistance protein